MAARPTPTIAGSPRVFLRGGTERNAHSKAAMTTALSASTLTGVNGVSVKTTCGWGGRGAGPTFCARLYLSLSLALGGPRKGDLS